ncbi:hypothetical protein [Actinomycetospora sp. NBRC 106378]|uniref:hypothetical protein n=1 Tax=Actinomycetospora sp. NBRC 106378 TaxID=3032208 RepID=UPI0024A07F0F|nr:hypothetical protein [Actinomycetospora sp. NBRC 106378]GLZ50656.1 hypothetical protein Acsp07_02730 [Actinomycetospora sp. NBRC 106378]
MQMFRKAAVATVILGAGLASTAGVAMANEHHDAGKGCSNTLAAKNSNGADRTLGDTTGGDQDLSGSNVCDILNGNKILSGNNAATGASAIRNGDDTTRTDTRTSNTSSNIVTDLLGL